MLAAIVGVWSISANIAWAEFKPLTEVPCDDINGGVCPFRVNTSSFANNMNGLSLSEDQAEWWQTFAASTWVTRTGANLPFEYAGRTTIMNVPCEDSSLTNKDGVSVVAALPSEHELGPNYKAVFVQHASGAVSLGSFSDDIWNSQRRPSMTEAWDGSTDWLFASLYWSNNASDWAQGEGVSYTSKHAGSPFSSYSWEGTGLRTSMPAALAGSAYVDVPYLFYVE